MLYRFLGFFLAMAPFAVNAEMGKPAESAHKQVTADELKSWYDQKKVMVVLDARTKPYFDGKLLPQAKWLSAESSEQEIQEAVPSKDSLVVVYCFSATCPASGWLYDKLASMGYTNVYEYHEGIQGWTKRGFPITNAKQ